jgi:hypothetical protein
MRKLIVSAILVSFSSIAILAQQNDKSNSKPSVSLPPSAVAADIPAVPSFQLPPLDFTSGRLPTVNSGSREPADSTKDEGPFVVLRGAVYMRLPAGPLVPVSGGGASGCFSLDLPQRIKNLKEFVPRLSSLQQQ